MDFYLTDYEIAIECQGVQHFKPINHFGGEDGFNKVIKRDNLKRRVCSENNIKLLYFTMLKDVDVDNYMNCGCYTNIDNLIKDIKANKISERK